ncbi:MAG: YybS family protein [Treponema sp.]|nr:YybS family protein [Treponema sp.]
MENPEGRRFFNNPAFFRTALAVAGAASSVACFRTGYFVFFLLPLGLSSFLGDAKSVWAAGILATALNVIVSLWAYEYRGENPAILQWNALFYSALTLFFTWINAPLSKFWIYQEIPYRMAAGAVLCTLILSPISLSLMNNPQFNLLVARQLEVFGSGWPEVSVEEALSNIMAIGLRGGILFICLVFWWLNRQFASLICRIIGRAQRNAPGNFLAFRMHPFFIWILSFSLGAIVLGKTGNIEFLEIGGWNFLILSVTLFLVQGGAVGVYFLSRLPPLPRIIINVGIIFLLFRPGINWMILGLFVILGIADNWVSFRKPKNNE